MTKFIVKRIGILIPVLFGMTVLNFLILQLSPGTAADIYVNPNSTQEDIERLEQMLGLDAPLHQQYISWLNEAMQGNLGFSFSSFKPVTEILLERLGPTLLLMGTALLLAYIVAIPIGILSAVKQYSKTDYIITFFSFLGTSIPSFFLGLIGIYLFAVVIPIFPTGGMQTMGSDGDFFDILSHLILPACILAAGLSGKMIRYVRSSMLEVLQQDYLRTARAKGLSEFITVNKHGFRNALIPLITIISLDAPILIAGAVVTEQIFQWPGIGQLTIQSITSRDYPVLMAINLLTALVVIGVNLITDIMYSVVDPRIKHS